MKKYFKFIVTLVITLNLTINIAHASVQVPSENKIKTQEVDRLQKIKEKGVLTVLSSNFEPFSYRDPITNTFRGTDAEIIQEVAKRLGIKEVKVKYVLFDGLLESLISNPEVDLIAQGMFILDERKPLVNFTIPIYFDEDGIVTKKDSNINSKEDLKNAIIGVVGGTKFTSIAEEWKKQGIVKDYRVFNDVNSLQKAFENKIVQAMLIGIISQQNYLLKSSKLDLKLLSPFQYKPEIKGELAYVLKKEDTTLLKAINEKLQEMKNDGTIYQIIIKYGFRYNYIP
ncbi:transporter substrate-binding domain-containing protein [Clostridium sp. SHJSY1]|uniref:substrate-binding periplasmic protein n=1 Tax=Clostridium sp. SHJSY1 TaxID=2942483 RepID=UPI002875B1E0|nr:transporter substrate-binding domain-containing protein [Clostridium sp. SHJSY1]MDS0527716.1 transporter substrate-binding domain-containing protein [Clostridium sp. SHJSY1]